MLSVLSNRMFSGSTDTLTKAEPGPAPAGLAVTGMRLARTGGSASKRTAPQMQPPPITDPIRQAPEHDARQTLGQQC